MSGLGAREDFRNWLLTAAGSPPSHVAMAGSFIRAASSGQRGCPRKGSTTDALAYTRANGSRCSIMRPYQSAAASRSDVSRW